MIDNRIYRLRQELDKSGLDGALIFSDINRNYLTGFTGNDSYIIVTQDELLFITDSRYTEQARIEVPDFQIIEYNINIIEFISKTVESLGIKVLGFEDNIMTYKFFNELKCKLENCQLTGMNEIIEKHRQTKGPEEINNIEKAAGITDEAFKHILSFIKPGITEISIALELEFFMRSNGATSVSFPIIAASGVRSSLPHGIASNKIIECGDILTLDFGCVYNGYCSDMTRTLILGSATEKQKQIYNIVLDANTKALSHIKPGITGEELDTIARDVITESGYGNYFGHGLGHGVGMAIHELPYVSKKGKEPIEAGMIITDEPGIYIPDYGGVRIEELVLVTENGYRVLSKSPKELIEIS